MQNTDSIKPDDLKAVTRGSRRRNTGGLRAGALSLGISIAAHSALVLFAVVMALSFARREPSAQVLPAFTVNCVEPRQELVFESKQYVSTPITVVPDYDVVEMPAIDAEKILAVHEPEKKPSEYKLENPVIRLNTARVPFQVVVRENARGPAKEPVGSITAAKIVENNPKPSYPYFARTMNYEGLVVVRVEIAADGTAARIEIAESSGYNILDEAAVDTVKEWAFVPAMKDGIAITTWLEIPIRFMLTE